MSEDVVKPITGSFIYQYKNNKGEVKKEKVTRDYQSISKVFERVLLSIIATEYCDDVSDIEKSFLIIGGDHGKGCLSFANSFCDFKMWNLCQVRHKCCVH